MAEETITALGPLFGPNLITVQVNDESNRKFQLEVFPDANNPLLKMSGTSLRFYFMPQRVYLAKKREFPTDFDFGATIFKGLMTTADTVGITDAMTESGSVSEGGGFAKYINPLTVPLPKPAPPQMDTINGYIEAAQAQALGV